MDKTSLQAASLQAARSVVPWRGLPLITLVEMHAYWLNFFEGPYAVSESNAAALSYFNEARPFVTVTGSQVIDSGVREYTTETRNGVKQSPYVSSAYSVLIVGNSGLVVKGNAPLSATGELKPLPADIPALVFPGKEDTALRSRLYPVILDTSDNYRVIGYVLIGVVMLYGLLLWVFPRKSWGYLRNISTHPVVKRVESWSDAAEVVTLSEREMSTPRFKGSGVLITDTFVIVRGFFIFNLLAWNHLVWAYRKQTTTLYYFVIPIARTQEAILHFYGGSASFRAGKKIVEEVLLFAHQQAPWVVLGYSDELNSLWTKRTADFTTAVEQRREELQKPYVPPPPVTS